MNNKKWMVILAGILCLSSCITGVWATEIGVAWEGKSGMAGRVVQGMEEALEAVAPDIKIEYAKELADLDALKEVADRFQSEKDGMVILRSSGAQFLANNPPSIPAFIGATNNPVELGVVKDMAKPEGKITGVTYFLSHETQLETFQGIVPGLQSILLLVENGHPGTAIDVAGSKEACKTLGLELTIKECATRDEVLAAVKGLSGEGQVVVLGNQALVFDNAGDVVKAAGKTPVLSFNTAAVKQGALCAVAADDIKLGQMLGESIVDVLVTGKAINEVPVKVDPNPKLSINITTAETLGLEIPYEILSASEIFE